MLHILEAASNVCACIYLYHSKYSTIMPIMCNGYSHFMLQVPVTAIDKWLVWSVLMHCSQCVWNIQ